MIIMIFSKILFLEQKAYSKINELSNIYYELIASFEQMKFNTEEIPNVNLEYCMEFLNK
jgi:hypothetical protein